jgi:hypothetical protein
VIRSVGMREVRTVKHIVEECEGTWAYIMRFVLKKQGTAVAQCLRYCATNRKVAGSIPDGVNGIFH